jgi:CheY-like chemotaxis protein
MSAASTVSLPRLLCVDDDPVVLATLAIQLGREFEVLTADNGDKALEIMRSSGPIAVVLSDMRMPHMDGATLLSRVRQQWPDTVRILSTADADLSAAISVVNNGRVSRCLTKSASPGAMMQAVREAVEQYRLKTSERDLLERTLRGAVQALAEVLALTDPGAFGRAGRVQRLALTIAARAQLEPHWPLELAALLSQLGSVSLPHEVVKKVYLGDALSAEEEAMVRRMPEVTDRLLAPIPRLEVVREILRQSSRPGAAGGVPPGAAPELRHVLRSAAILRLAEDFDQGEMRGLSDAAVLAQLRSRGNEYDSALVAHLEAIIGAKAADRFEIRELPVRLLQIGMVLADDLRNRAGLLLAPRGSEITSSFVERARNFPPGSVREPVRVMLRPDGIATSKTRHAA